MKYAKFQVAKRQPDASIKVVSKLRMLGAYGNVLQRSTPHVPLPRARNGDVRDCHRMEGPA